MNPNKTKIMNYECYADQVIENVDCINLEHVIKLGERKKSAEINRRFRKTWTSESTIWSHLLHILKDKNISINLKRQVFKTCKVFVTELRLPLSLPIYLEQRKGHYTNDVGNNY